MTTESVSLIVAGGLLWCFFKFSNQKQVTRARNSDGPQGGADPWALYFRKKASEDWLNQ